MRRPRVIIFDLDGVITKIKNSWEYLHTYFAPGSDRSFSRALADRYLRGEISYARWMAYDIEVLLRNTGRSIHRDEVYEAFSRVEIYREIIDVMRISREAGVRNYAIVSGGVSVLARIAGDRLGIRDVYANHLVFDPKGFLVPAGIPVVEPLGKGRVVRELVLSRIGIDEEEAVFIGDSIWDLSALSIVGYPVVIGCRECLYREGLADKALYVSDHRELVRALKIMLSRSSPMY